MGAGSGEAISVGVISMVGATLASMLGALYLDGRLDDQHFCIGRFLRLPLGGSRVTAGGRPGQERWSAAP